MGSHVALWLAECGVRWRVFESATAFTTRPTARLILLIRPTGSASSRWGGKQLGRARRTTAGRAAPGAALVADGQLGHDPGRGGPDVVAVDFGLGRLAIKRVETCHAWVSPPETA
jgi:hypothetical protein